MSFLFPSFTLTAVAQQYTWAPLRQVLVSFPPWSISPFFPLAAGFFHPISVSFCLSFPLPPSFPWHDRLWKYLECTQFVRSQVVGVAFPLSLIYRRMQRVAKQGHTHSSVFVYTHALLHTHTHAEEHFHVIKVWLCSVWLAGRPVSVIDRRL